MHLGHIFRIDKSQICLWIMGVVMMGHMPKHIKYGRVRVILKIGDNQAVISHKAWAHTQILWKMSCSLRDLMLWSALSD